MKDNIFNKKFGYVYRNAVAYLIAINFFVYIAINYIKPVISGIPLVYWLSLVPVFIRQGYVWQFFTYMFVHMEFFHLFFNMYALFMFGTMLERAIGTKEFLLFYFVTGVLGGVAN
ncbi:MAG: rhomboid family intramembrane serine protease, partial [Spirochaetales bacterium]